MCLCFCVVFASVVCFILCVVRSRACALTLYFCSCLLYSYFFSFRCFPSLFIVFTFLFIVFDLFLLLLLLLLLYFVAAVRAVAGAGAAFCWCYCVSGA